MSDFRETVPDDEREVPLDDEAEFETPPPTLDPMEAIEDEPDEHILHEREDAIEAGEIEP